MLLLQMFPYIILYYLYTSFYMVGLKREDKKHVAPIHVGKAWTRWKNSLSLPQKNAMLFTLLSERENRRWAGRKERKEKKKD